MSAGRPPLLHISTLLESINDMLDIAGRSERCTLWSSVRAKYRIGSNPPSLVTAWRMSGFTAIFDTANAAKFRTSASEEVDNDTSIGSIPSAIKSA